jgi:MoxR-like ATPase
MDYDPTHFNLPADDTWPGSDDFPPYLFNEEIAVAVDVALATRRPLLIAGPPGSGKSMLAPAMAGLLPCRYLRHTFTSRSRLGELTSELDHLRRLHEAQARVHDRLPPEWAYREPGLFWWAFEPETARRRGARPADVKELGAAFKTPDEPENVGAGGDAVILLDEIDKAEPDLPNDLLEPLDRLRFQVSGGPEVRAPAKATFLVIITTNGERELPPAFLRRCVSLVLKHPTQARLVEIGQHHFPDIEKGRLEQVAERFDELRQQAQGEGLRLPSTSEYLDAVEAAEDLKIGTDDPFWQQVESAALAKRTAWTDELEEEA